MSSGAPVRDVSRVLPILSWIAVGAGIGLVASTLSPELVPGGRVGAVVAAAAGGFLGGGLLALLIHRGVARVSLATLAAAAVAAVLELAAIRRAEYAEPRPR